MTMMMKIMVLIAIMILHAAGDVVDCTVSMMGPMKMDVKNMRMMTVVMMMPTMLC